MSDHLTLEEALVDYPHLLAEVQTMRDEIEWRTRLQAENYTNWRTTQNALTSLKRQELRVGGPGVVHIRDLPDGNLLFEWVADEPRNKA